MFNATEAVDIDLKYERKYCYQCFIQREGLGHFALPETAFALPRKMK
jgi:hypothetical protein